MNQCHWWSFDKAFTTLFWHYSCFKSPVPYSEKPFEIFVKRTNLEVIKTNSKLTYKDMPLFRLWPLCNKEQSRSGYESNSFLLQAPWCLGPYWLLAGNQWYIPGQLHVNKVAGNSLMFMFDQWCQQASLPHCVYSDAARESPSWLLKGARNRTWEPSVWTMDTESECYPQHASIKLILAPVAEGDVTQF